MVRNIINHRYFIWAVLALPSIPMIAALASGGSGPNGVPLTEMLLHPTGEFSARFLIITMMLTPLRLLFPVSGFLRWMIKRRRYFGMAAFFYALFHTVLYVVDMKNLQAILDEFFALGIWTGWLAMLIFIPLALTSTDSAVRKLGLRWKPLQRMVYIAAVATLLHWIFVHNNLVPALVHFVPLAALETYRLYCNSRAKSQRIQEV
ncbi:sulfite oxidase heme-binding subunit YedZ [Shimia sp.]|uniref:sulfite oxidase heme-binding subunit YedZ n=1 Tax=Shimia sp. TaxID=1954381 RepID=UPI003B8E53F3